jgi:F0F1-type ATP synthase assembly protein I
MTDRERENVKKEAKSYLKWSGLAFQLLGGIGLFGWLGYTLDRHIGLTFPIFMLLFGFTVFAGILYQVYKSVKNQ